MNTVKSDSLEQIEADLRRGSHVLRDFLAAHPGFPFEVVQGTSEHPETIELVRDVGWYQAQLVLSDLGHSVIFASLDIWHKVNRKKANVYYDARASSLDEALTKLETCYGEWQQRVNSPRQHLRLVHPGGTGERTDTP